MRVFTPSFAKTIPPHAEAVFQGILFSVYHWPQELYDGSTATFEMLRRPDTVQVLAVQDDKITVTYQRQPRKDWFYSLPGGRHDHPDEDELAAAKRELLEEAGLTFRDWRLIDVRQPFSKIDWLVYTFLATEFVSAVAPTPDAGEDIKVLELTFDEIKSLRYDPSASSLFKSDIFTRFHSLSELLSAPSLYQY